jgi:hypothetical protein
MARNRRKKALYEVMSKAKLKPGYGRTLEQTQPKKSAEAEPAAKQKKSTLETPKPRIAQFNAGRFEFSIPYQLAIAAVLVLILLIVAAYRVGQSSYSTGRQGAGEPSEGMQETGKENPTGQATSDMSRYSTRARDVSQNAKKVGRPKSTGNNVIVLAQFSKPADLAPVKTHFARYDIETEIVPENGRWFLQTKQKYDNPATRGTDGYKARQKIIEVGAKYKAPPGFDTFATHLFSDAYGKNVK